MGYWMNEVLAACVGIWNCRSNGNGLLVFLVVVMEVQGYHFGVD